MKKRIILIVSIVCALFFFMVIGIIIGKNAYDTKTVSNSAVVEDESADSAQVTASALITISPLRE